jgi:glycosyltransferase involved in cell wall biosynthesis
MVHGVLPRQLSRLACQKALLNGRDPAANVTALKILFIERSLGRGGAQRQLVALAIGLAQRGHDVTVALFYNEGALIKDLLENGVRLQMLDKRGRWDVTGVLRGTLRLLADQKPDIVCTFLSVPNLVAAACKLLRWDMRLVWGVRASNMDLQRYDSLTALSYRLETFGSRLADLIVSNSEAGRRIVLANGFPARKVTVIANGIDAEKFQFDPHGRQRVRESWNVSDAQFLVGLIGRLDPMKDHRTFLAAAARLWQQFPEMRFVCVGDEGPIAFEELARQASQMGIGDRLIWSAGRDDMPAVYSACDLVCSSSAYGEGFSNTIAEAMACGRHCVVTDVGDSSDIVEATGLVVPPRNEVALADAIALLRRTAGDGDLHGSPRARIIGNFSIEKMVSLFEDQFQRLLGRDRCRV